MEKRTAGRIHSGRNGQLLVLLLLSACFIFGALAGCFVVSGVDEAGSLALSDYLEQYLHRAAENAIGTPGILKTAESTFAWPLVIFLLGVTALGIIGIPAAFLVRGFLFSFAAASFFRLWGVSGLLLACAAFGLTGLFGLPVLFVLGVQCFSYSRWILNRLIGNNSPVSPPPGIVLPRILLCLGALFICFLLEYKAVPALLSATAKLIL